MDLGSGVEVKDAVIVESIEKSFEAMIEGLREVRNRI